MPILKKEVDIFPVDLLGPLPEESGKKPPVSEDAADPDSAEQQYSTSNRDPEAKPEIAYEDPDDAAELWLPGDSPLQMPGQDEAEDDGSKWWCIYTMSRQEKALMRKLHAAGKSFCCPLIENRYRSPAGRIRSSFLPLLTNYVFLKGNEDDRYFAFQTNCISKCNEVESPDQLVSDLRRLYTAIRMGCAMKAEELLAPGDPIEVRSGPFKGYEGYLLRREGKTRLLVFLRYLEKGVSMVIDDAMVRAV